MKADFEEKKHEIEISNAVFNSWDCKNLKGYMKLYLEVDVLLLCEALDDFRNKLISYYKIDPLYSFTLPGYSWKAWGFMSKVKLEYFQNRD